jgi:hypothetical protein
VNAHQTTENHSLVQAVSCAAGRPAVVARNTIVKLHIPMLLFAERHRKRALYALLVVVVICAGLASRKYPHFFPAQLGKYPGDALWAMMMFFILGALKPRWSSAAAGALALFACYLVEFSQLLQPHWLVTIRQTTIGHLVLGSHFHAQDLLAYAVGICAGVLVEVLAIPSEPSA